MPASATTQPAGRLHLRVGQKFFLPLSVLIAALLLVSAVAITGLHSMHSQTSALYRDDLTAVQAAHEALTALDDIDLAALQLIATQQQAEITRQEANLDDRLLPEARAALDRLRHLPSIRGRMKELDPVSAGLDAFTALRASGGYERRGLGASQGASGEALARRTSALFASLTGPLDDINAREAQEAQEADLQSDVDYRATRRTLLLIVAVSLLLSLVSLVGLIRNVVPRLKRYAHFATQVAAGVPQETLPLTGRDELTQLGQALNQMVRSRQDSQATQRAQNEFVETLQVTDSETEAHLLLQHHLRRSIDPARSIAVLNRNNSADRLEPATDLPEGSPLVTGLIGASPRSCLAVRLARTHAEGDEGRPPLLACQVCTGLDSYTTCEPLIVSGEVIGSVLLGHDRPLAPQQLDTIKQSVFQAAPLLGNLRSLALAQFRANNDFLTGLANKRATEDTLRRMVAQANRSLSPLAAIMVDLDHFKKINDLHGHGVGDEALAAVGAALADSIRASDYAGRYGGEEFLLLLPDTGSDDAAHVAEKVRLAIAALSIPALQGPLTASFGVAALPADSGDASGLLRQADRALHQAKAEGRNRVVQARHHDGETEPVTIAPPANVTVVTR